MLGFRDEVAGVVRAAEFSDLQGLIAGLNTGVQNELDKLGQGAGRRAGPGAAGRVLRLAPRPVFLAGREGLLGELEARLGGEDGAGPRVVALYGLGGAGKTSVAMEYAHRQLAGAGVAWQFGAEDPAVLAAGFGELAALLGAADGGDPVAGVHAVLAGGGSRWLLVFDNAPDRASVAAFVPPAGPGRVLITSRNQIWPPGQAVEVPMLDRAVAAEFLAARTGDADRRAALELAGELGGLPLALEQAGAYMQASGRGIAEYLGLFRARRAELLGKGIRPGMTSGSPPPGRWRSPRSARRARQRGCCGWWRAARPRTSRCPCCCAPAWPRKTSMPWSHQCWCRCWAMSWHEMRRWRGCGGSR